MKPPNIPSVDDCLMLRENGIVQDGPFYWCRYGDWNVYQHRLTLDSKQVDEDNCVSIPTLSRIIDFARELAREFIVGFISVSIELSKDGVCLAEVNYQNKIESGNGNTRYLRSSVGRKAATPELALVALIKEMLKQKEVK